MEALAKRVHHFLITDSTNGDHVKNIVNAWHPVFVSLILLDLGKNIICTLRVRHRTIFLNKLVEEVDQVELVLVKVDVD